MSQKSDGKDYTYRIRSHDSLDYWIVEEIGPYGWERRGPLYHTYLFARWKVARLRSTSEWRRSRKTRYFE